MIRRRESVVFWGTSLRESTVDRLDHCGCHPDLLVAESDTWIIALWGLRCSGIKPQNVSEPTTLPSLSCMNGFLNEILG